MHVVDGDGNTQVVGDANNVAGRDAASGQSAITSGTTSTVSVNEPVQPESETRVPIGNRIAAVVFLLVLIAGIVLLVLGVLAPAIGAIVIGGGGFGLAIFKLFFDK